jgi:hypothetical protein
MHTRSGRPCTFLHPIRALHVHHLIECNCNSVEHPRLTKLTAAEPSVSVSQLNPYLSCQRVSQSNLPRHESPDVTSDYFLRIRYMAVRDKTRRLATEMAMATGSNRNIISRVSFTGIYRHRTQTLSGTSGASPKFAPAVADTVNILTLVN